MAFTLSGNIAAGVQDALAEVLDRRLKEQLRLQQEKQAEADLELRRQQLALQQQTQRDLETDRAADREFRSGQVARGDAETLLRDLSPGAISGEAATTIRKSPAHAARVVDLTEIQARPGVLAAAEGIGGEARPAQTFSQLQPTSAQAKEAKRVVDLRAIGEELAGATSEQQRRAVGARAAGQGLADELPTQLIGPTEEEKLRTRLEDERRGNAEWDRRNKVQEDQLRSRPVRTATQLSTRDKIIQTRMLRNDFLRETKGVRESLEQAGLMQRSMKALEDGLRTQGGQGVLVTFQKILDPESVVREAEYERGTAGQALIDRMRAQWQAWTVGGVPMTAENLRGYVQLANDFAKLRVENAKASTQQIREIAESFELDPDLVTRDYSLDEGPQENTAGGGSGKTPYQQYLEGKGKSK